MNCERESWILSLDEIAAILSLVGRERFVGLAEMQAQPLQTQDILNACCRLLQDRMMTQENTDSPGPCRRSWSRYVWRRRFWC